MAIASSPIDIVFQRSGGADIQGEIQVWQKKATFGPADRPVMQVQFGNPLLSREAKAITLPPGDYICVVLVMAREALNGVFDVRVTVEGDLVFAKHGDANTTPKGGDITNLRGEFPLTVA